MELGEKFGRISRDPLSGLPLFLKSPCLKLLIMKHINDTYYPLS